jgi:hypothetical protein
MTVTEILFKVALTLSTIKQTKPSIYDPFDIFKHFFFSEPNIFGQNLEVE